VDDRQIFIDLLAKDEDNNTTRLIYADWLEDNGFHEESERQRKWPDAKKWMLDIVEQGNADRYYEYEDLNPLTGEITKERYEGEWYIDYPTLMQLAAEEYRERTKDSKNGEWSGGDFWGFHVGNNMTMQEVLGTNRVKFWENWSILTGHPMPKNPDDSFFRCAC
jgi:uncharacterized protein (TIGR02996 family)